MKLNFLNSRTKKLVLLLLIDLFLFFGVVFVYLGTYYLFFADNTYLKALYYNSQVEELNQPSIKPVENSFRADDFPVVISYGAKWATLSVDGWKKQNIPVYFGDSETYLSKGAGMWIGSRFCGQRGRVVLSAHVTRDFSELEDTYYKFLDIKSTNSEEKITITMETVYGTYIYEIVDAVIFNGNDNSYVFSDNIPGDTLLMYTCFPKKNNGKKRVERCALIGKCISGKEYYVYE